MTNPEKVTYEAAARGDVPELWGTTQVAKHLKVRMSNLDKQVGLPPPLPRPPAPLVGGRLWLADEVREYARRRRERNGNGESPVHDVA